MTKKVKSGDDTRLRNSRILGLEFLDFLRNSSLGILEFLKRNPLTPRKLEFLVKNSRIPKPCVIPRLDRGISSQNRDLPVKLEDDIVGNSRIPKTKNIPAPPKKPKKPKILRNFVSIYLFF